MKKVLTTLLSALLLAGLATTAGAWEENVDYVSYGEITSAKYPASTTTSDKVKWPECTSGTLLKGTIIAGSLNGVDCAEGNVATNAFDGNSATVFTGFETTNRSYVGLILDQAYELTEIRVRPGDGKPADRLHGLVVEGSNDGIHWAKIVEHRQDAQGSEYHLFTPQSITEQSYIDAGYTFKKDHSLFWCGGEGSYSIYRVWSLGCELNIGEIEFYGNAAEATVLDDEAVAALIPTTTWFPGNINIRDTILEKPLATVEGAVLGKVIHAGGTWARAYPERAFDNDHKRAYDPCYRGVNCWVGMMYDEPYAMTEVWVRPRRGTDAPKEIEGAMIQGSLDGKTWVTLVQYTAEDIPATQEWVKKPIADQGGYIYFRYVTSVLTHGAIGDIAFFGAPGAAATNIPEAEKYPVATYDTFLGEIIDTGITSTSVDGSIVGTVIGYGDIWFMGRDPYNNNANESYERAFDGTAATYTDFEKKGPLVFTGIKTDVPYVVTEVKVHTTSGTKNISGAHVQGSVDGITWVDLAVFTDADIPAEAAWVAKTVEGAGEYSYFRYAPSDYNGCAVAEVAFYGTAVEVPETQAPETAAPETQAPETAAPETAAPETQAPETAAPETQAPETAAPEAPADVVKLNDYATIIKGEAVTADVTLAFDGNKDTGTAFGGADSDHWAGIKLDQPTVLSYVSLLSGQIARPDRIFLAEIEGSNDGINWEPILQLGDVYAEYEDYANDVWGADNYAMWVEYAFDGGADEYGDEDAAEPKAYTYYRVFNTDNDNWGEIEFWGTIVEEAPEATVEFDLVDTVAQAGGTVEVTINAAAGIPANSFALYELTYDPAVLTFVEFTGFGEIVTDSFFGTDAVDNELKTIMFAYENAAEFEGLVAKIKFTVNADAAEGTTEVTMKALVKNDSAEIKAAVDGAVIEVKAAGTYVPGDIDGNGALDLQDALNLFQYSMMPDIYELTYVGNIDYVADGNIDILDALYLFQSSMMPDIYPIY